MNKFLKNFTTIAIGAGVGGLLAGGGFLIYKYAFEKDEPEHKDPSAIYQMDTVMEGNKEVKVDYLPLLREYNFEDTDKPFLGEKGMKMLSQRIHDDLGFGPEIYGLKSISLSPGYIIGSGNNGVFFPGTNEIFINSSNVRKMLPENANDKSKVEIVFQILVHEYGHYIASQYVETSITTSNTANIYDTTRSSGRIKGHWNKKFTDRFKTLLHYSNNKTYYNTKTITHDKKVWNTLSSQLNVQDLFAKANGVANPTYSELKPHTAFVGKIDGAVPVQLDASRLKYLYSMSELFTRKYQMLSYIPKVTNSILNTGWIKKTTEKHHASPYLSDVLNFQSSIKNELHRNPIDFRFMKDAPFGLDNHGNSTVGASVNLYNALLQQFGVNNGADISIIYPENNNTMKNYKYMDLSGSSSRIKIGGYITKGSKYKEIGYMDNGKFKKIDDIKTGNFTYKHRISFNDNISKNDLTKIGVGSETQFYITKHYNNGSSFVNKELYLSDGVHQFKLKTTRSGSFVGKTSSYRPYFPSRLGRTYYEAVVSNSKLMIKEQTWT